MTNTDPGNAAATRAIALQLFDVWKAEQGEQATKQRASWPAWLGAGAVVVGFFLAAGDLRGQVAADRVRIDKIEKRLDAQDEAIVKITDRLARIETKLDLALEHRKGGQ